MKINNYLILCTTILLFAVLLYLLGLVFSVDAIVSRFVNSKLFNSDATTLYIKRNQMFSIITRVFSFKKYQNETEKSLA